MLEVKVQAENTKKSTSWSREMFSASEKRKLNVDFNFVAKWTTCTTVILYAEYKSERG